MKTNIIETLKGDLKEYSSIPFWSWNNELDTAELLRQISEFKSLGIDAFIMHARTGLKTEYLGEKWFECIGACLSEAKRLDMKAWIYDENGWPSGFVEGRLLQKEENLAQYIKYEIKKEFDADASAVYVLENGAARRVFCGAKNMRDYHCLYIKSHSSYADILNESVVSQFISATHEQYYKRFGDSFGHEMAGFFTDEPQYFRWETPYSRILPEEFEKAYGENILDGLVYLFIDCQNSKLFRYKYYALLNKLFTENFYKRLYDWCEAHNCALTGHALEEKRIHAQLWCCAGIMPTYEFEHVPGVDWLGRSINCAPQGKNGGVNFIGQGIDCAIAPKQAGSVAQQLGKKRVLTETFACSGWDATPRELRRIAEFQYVNGVNTMCQHLCSYSIKGQGKSDYPPSFTRHNAWISESKIFNDYFKRLSFILCNTKEASVTLVIHPLRSAYMTYKRSEDYYSVKAVEDAFLELTQALSEKGAGFHYGDETILKRHAKIEGDSLVVGNCRYTNVIVPVAESIDGFTAELLRSFQANGGKICLYGGVPAMVGAKEARLDLISDFTLDEIMVSPCITVPRPSPLMVSRRKGDIGEFLYIFNSSVSETVSFELDARFRVLNLEALTVEDAVLPLTISPTQTLMLMLDENAEPQKKCSARKEKDITTKFEYLSSSDNCLTVDYISISRNGADYSAPEFIHSVNEKLIKEGYTGKLWIKYSFFVKHKPSKAKIMFEQADFAEVSLNGKALSLSKSALDVFFSECDIASHINEGSNDFVLCLNYFQKPEVKHILYDPDVMESLKNCLAIDTEIESVYVLGDFAVDKSRAVTKRGKIQGADNMQTKGFMNFAGKMTFAADIELDCEYKSLRIEGRYMSAEVTVNGHKAGTALLSESVDVSRHLVAGKNRIEISVTSSMRNMLGPHHYAPEPEPNFVGHHQFNFRGTWKDGKAPDFTKEYNLVKFGLDKIVLVK